MLLLAAFTLTYRLGLESVEEWDESLYATTAWEMLQSGDLIGTTFGGEQGVLLLKRDGFRGTRVCRDRLHRGEAFIVKAMMHTDFHLMSGPGRGGPARSGDPLRVLTRGS